ncbi:MAG TPA: VWA-like domain-containing protein [Candidatus Omnitrophota bacterium]|nr:VWA-like domain-containing protein [Candidatus Omnitrophota bacterium]
MIEEMVVSLVQTKPFYAHFIQQMNRIETEKIPTLGVNIRERINLYFNPRFLEGLAFDERVACLEHEVLHLLHLHLFRGDGKNHRIFNIACDLAINTYIENLPKIALLPKLFGFEDEQTAEWYYKKLCENSEKLATKIAKAGESMLDDHELWEDSEGESDPEYQQEFLRRAIKISLDETEDYGSLPGNMSEELKEFLKGSKVNWKSVLERFLIHATLVRSILSRKRPNRRFEEFPGQKVEQKLKLLIGLDTSGSVSDRELALFFAEIEKIKALGMDITVAECDSKIGNVYRYKTRPKAVSGRGGTSFRPVFDLAEKLRPDALLYLTDGEGDYPERSKYSTLWCLTPDGNFSGKFGKVLKLPQEK